MKETTSYRIQFIPYALAAFLIGIVGGFSTVLGPAFVQDIGIPYNNTTWTTLAQAMSTAACAPILGKLGDRWGRRRMLLLGIAVFTLGNILSAYAYSLATMVLARFIVGIGTASMAPLILAFIVSEFPEDRVAKGFSLYMLISSASVVLGPSLGAKLIAFFGWRAMLWVCVGICVAVLLACLCFREKDRKKQAELASFDIAGGGTVLLFFSLLLCIPTVGQNIGWNTKAFALVAIGALISLGILIALERRAIQPILPARFIRRRAFLLSVLILFLTQGLMQVNITSSIVFVNYTHPEDTSVSGYAISVLYLGMSIGAVTLGPLSDRIRAKFVLLGALTLTALGCGAMLLFSQNTDISLMVLSLGLLGLGLGGNGTVLMKIALSDLPSEDAGGATGTYGLFRDLAAPFGVAILLPLFTNQVASRITHGTPAPEAAVEAVHLLAVLELLCVLAASVGVWYLPENQKKENGYEA